MKAQLHRARHKAARQANASDAHQIPEDKKG